MFPMLDDAEGLFAGRVAAFPSAEPAPHGTMPRRGRQSRGGHCGGPWGNGPAPLGMVFLREKSKGASGRRTPQGRRSALAVSCGTAGRGAAEPTKLLLLLDSA